MFNGLGSKGLGSMTKRNLTYELLYIRNVDMENGDDVESIAKLEQI